ncbi:hypothetical protein [Rhodanobacter soli]|uniref:DNA-binding protein n=1 Tax=Rhodanobacter soli TaxID=590609 RepID=A0ABV2PWJ8_9GAMM
MPDTGPQATTEQSAQRIEDGLREDFGALLTQADLARLLRYPTVQAVRKARARGNLAIPMFQLPMRRGWFATARAVAEFLAILEQRPLITAQQIANLPNYPSAGTVRQAYQRDTLPVSLSSGKSPPSRQASGHRNSPDRTAGAVPDLNAGAMTEEEAS